MLNTPLNKQHTYQRAHQHTSHLGKKKHTPSLIWKDTTSSHNTQYIVLTRIHKTCSWNHNPYKDQFRYHHKPLYRCTPNDSDLSLLLPGSTGPLCIPSNCGWCWCSPCKLKGRVRTVRLLQSIFLKSTLYMYQDRCIRSSYLSRFCTMIDQNNSPPYSRRQN